MCALDMLLINSTCLLTYLLTYLIIEFMLSFMLLSLVLYLPKGLKRNYL